jgi:hypothetical protein
VPRFEVSSLPPPPPHALRKNRIRRMIILMAATSVHTGSPVPTEIVLRWQKRYQ